MYEFFLQYLYFGYISIFGTVLSETSLITVMSKFEQYSNILEENAEQYIDGYMETELDKPHVKFVLDGPYSESRAQFIANVTQNDIDASEVSIVDLEGESSGNIKIHVLVK